jgi:hypothetical protein
VLFWTKKYDGVKLPSGAMAKEATHPPEREDHGRLCKEHNVCGTVVKEDTLLHLRKEQILVDGQEETAISCYWVTKGIDHCCIGFLKRHMVKHAKRFDGALMQLTKVFSVDPHVFDTVERKCTIKIMVVHFGPSFWLYMRLKRIALLPQRV